MSDTRTKILVIEDNVSLLTNLCYFLEEMGYQVQSAADGLAGINLAKSWRPNLIICDISIPIRDGYEVIKELGQDPQTRVIPFIFLTAKVEKEDMRRGMMLGADDYIYKPFAFEDLLSSIKLRLAKVQMFSTPAQEDSKLSLDEKILIKTGKIRAYYALRDLKYIKAQNPYVYLKFKDGKSTLIRESVNSWELKLPESTFIRIHRTWIINRNFIEFIDTKGKSTCTVRLKTEDEDIPISRRYKRKFLDSIE
ncbi:MAG: response regulator [Ignavibacteria bacterium]|nr:response regulator [Ignavibacteria bacterium]